MNYIQFPIYFVIALLESHINVVVMSFAEAIRKAKGATVTPTIAKSLLDPNVNLPGDNTLEKLRNLYNIRKYGLDADRIQTN